MRTLKPAVLLRKARDVARRRWILMVTAFAAMAVASVAVARLMPQTFAARTLMMLQESGRGSVLRDASGLLPDRTQERVAGLQALLRSDEVLARSLQDMEPAIAGDPARLTGEMRSLRKDVALELVGSDFLEIQLKGSAASGLGDKLELITARFLDALMPDRRGTTALGILTERRKEDVARAEALVTRLRLLVGEADQREGSAGAASDQLAAAEALADAKAAELQDLESRLNESPSRPGRDGSLADLLRATTPRRALSMPGGGERADRGEDRILTDQDRLEIATARELDARRLTARTELSALRERAAAVRAEGDKRQAAERELAAAERALAEARDTYTSLVRRFAGADALRSGSILNAPERIVVIDPPRDPIGPSVSRFAYVLAGMAAAALLAVGLAGAAEFLDPVIYDADGLEAAAQLPLLAVLPRVAFPRVPRGNSLSG